MKEHIDGWDRYLFGQLAPKIERINRQEEHSSGQSSRIILDCEEIVAEKIPLFDLGGIGMMRPQSFQSYSKLQGTGDKRLMPIYATLRKENASIEIIQFASAGVYIGKMNFFEYTYHNGNQTVFYEWHFSNCMISRYEYFGEEKYLVFQTNYESYEFIKHVFDPKTGEEKGQVAAKGTIIDDKDE